MSNNPIAVLPLTNFGGIAINEINNDFVIYSWYEDKPRRAKIYYTLGGRAYILIRRMRFHLDEFMRC